MAFYLPPRKISIIRRYVYAALFYPGRVILECIMRTFIRPWLFQSIQDLVARISDGPIADFKAAAEKIHLVLQAMSLKLLEMFCTDFDPTKLGQTDATERVTAAMDAVGHFGTVEPCLPQYTRTMSRFWPDIYIWVSYICLKYLVRFRHVATEEQKDSINSRLYTTLYCTTRDPQLEAVVGNTVGVVKLVTIMWLRENSMETGSGDVPVSAFILSQLLAYPRTEIPDEIIAAVDGDADHIARLAVSRSRSSFERERIDPGNVMTYMNLLYRIDRQAKLYAQAHSSEDSHPIGLALVAASSVTAVTKMLVMLSDRMTTDVVDINTIRVGYQYLASVLEYQDGYSLVVQSVESGLLSAFVNSAPAFGQFKPEELMIVQRIIGDILPRYLVHRRVIRALRPFISMLRGPEVNANLSRSFSMTTKKLWYAFRLLALQRLYVRAVDKVDEPRVCSHVRSIFILLLMVKHSSAFM